MVPRIYIFFLQAVIDLEEPHLVLPTLAEKLKNGKAAVIYVSK